MTTAPPLSSFVIMISSLFLSSSSAFCSPFVRLEYFDAFNFVIPFWMSLFVASMYVSTEWCVFCGVQFLFDGFLNIFSSVSDLIVLSLKCALSLMRR